MKKFLLAIAIAGGITTTSSATEPMKRCVISTPEQEDQISCLPKKAPENEMSDRNPLKSSDPKRITYLAPDPFYTVTSGMFYSTDTDVLIRIGEDLLPRFRGNRITTIHAVLDNNISEASIVVRDVNGDMLFEEDLDVDQLEGYDVWDNGHPYGHYAEVPFDYEIGDEPLYVGYHIRMKEGERFGKWVVQVGRQHDDCCFTYSFGDENIMPGLSGYVPMIWIDTEGEGGLKDNDVALRVVDGARINTESEYSVQGSFTVLGVESLTELSFEYENEAGEIETYRIKTPEPYPYMNTISFTLPLKSGKEEGIIEREIRVSTVNGVDDEYATDNTANSDMIAIANSKHRTMFIEEFTGTWCGYCPRGLAAMDKLERDTDIDFISVEVHTNDDLDCRNEDYHELSTTIPGWPYAMVNRKYMCDPWCGLDINLPFGMLDYLMILKENPTEVNIEVAASNSPGSDVIEVESYTDFSFDVKDSSRYKVGYVLVEDGLTAIQQNNYSAEYGYMDKEDMPVDVQFLYDLPMYVEWTYKNTIRDAQGVFGIDSSFPDELEEGEQYGNHVSFSTKRIKDINNAKVIAYVIDEKFNEILNASITSVVTSGIAEMEMAVNLYRDGNKIVYESDEPVRMDVNTIGGTLVFRGDGTEVRTESLAKGLYVVKVTDANGTSVSRKIVL